jgi:hypothetical protein
MNKQSADNLQYTNELKKIIDDLDKVEERIFDKIKFKNDKTKEIKNEFKKTIISYHKLIKNLY